MGKNWPDLVFDRHRERVQGREPVANWTKSEV
uniref:Uncharacterized protein n=1 Tax=Anguilla anguilla TaxID=7936 RepID=A0A0E9S3B9_ANGAN